MAAKPRAAVLIDGQNLRFEAQRAFGHDELECSAWELAGMICEMQGWEMVRAAIYTGFPTNAQIPKWHRFWKQYFRVEKAKGTIIFKGKVVMERLGSKDKHTEKGVDSQIVIDVIRGAYENEFDVAVVVSLDEDFNGLSVAIRKISEVQKRKIRFFSAALENPKRDELRKIKGAKQIIISKADYDACNQKRNADRNQRPLF